MLDKAIYHEVLDYYFYSYGDLENFGVSIGDCGAKKRGGNERQFTGNDKASGGDVRSASSRRPIARYFN